MKENLILLFGGKSVEHDISIITALQIMRNIPKTYNVIPVYIERDGKWCIADNLTEVDTFIEFEKNVKKKREITLEFGSQYLYIKKHGTYKPFVKVDVALMCLHGGAGEDGSIASVLNMCNIPYTSSNHTSSAICMDKIFTKQVLSSSEIDNVPFCYFTKQEYVTNEKDVLRRIKKLGYPVIIKPANLGSSVAIDIAKNEKSIKDKISVALEFDDRILVEKYLEDCEEYNCACLILDDKLYTSKVIRVDKGEIFSFEEKYLEEDDKNEKKVEKNLQKAIKSLTKEVYNELGLNGVVRVDYLISGDKIFVNEVNSIPGSLSIHMFSGVSKREIIEALICDAKKKTEQKKRLTSIFKSEALEIFKSAVDLAKARK